MRLLELRDCDEGREGAGAPGPPGSPALIAAYELEKAARDPRVLLDLATAKEVHSVLDVEALELVGSMPLRVWRDTDERLFANHFDVALSGREGRTRKELATELDAQLKSGAEFAAGHPGHEAKWRWARSRFDEALSRWG